MEKSILTAALPLSLALSACAQGNDTAATTEMETIAAAEGAAAEAIVETKTKAVLVYADWCASCKALDPKVKAVQAQGDIAGLEYVTLDFTNRDDETFYAQADAAGVGKAVRDHLAGTVKTGQLLLIDLDDEKVLTAVTKTMEPEQISEALKNAVAAS